jgi:hypothetical protein
MFTLKITIVLLLALSLAGCSHLRGLKNQIIGSGVIKTETRIISSFTSIDASGAFDVEVVCQKEPSLEIEGDDNLLPLITTEVHGSTLTIKPEKAFSVKRSIRVRISVPNIEYISSSGATSFRVSNVKNDKMKIEASGASSFDIAGETVALDLALSGATKIDTETLHAARVRISLSGAGKAIVFASEELDADVSGAGSVTYAGNPKTVNKKVSGVGSVSKKDTAA